MSTRGRAAWVPGLGVQVLNHMSRDCCLWPSFPPFPHPSPPEIPAAGVGVGVGGGVSQHIQQSPVLRAPPLPQVSSIHAPAPVLSTWKLAASLYMDSFSSAFKPQLGSPHCQEVFQDFPPSSCFDFLPPAFSRGPQTLSFASGPNHQLGVQICLRTYLWKEHRLQGERTDKAASCWPARPSSLGSNRRSLHTLLEPPPPSSVPPAVLPRL